MMSEPHRLHPASIVIMALRIGRELLFPAIFPAVIWLVRAGREALSLEGLLFVLAGILLFVAITAGYGLLAWQRFTYRVEAGELRVEQGVITRQRRSIPLERVQTADYAQGLVQRALGIVSVRVETASGGGQSEVFLPGISRVDSQQLQAALIGARQPATEALVAVDSPIGPTRRLSGVELLIAGSTAGRVGVALSILFSVLTFADDLIPFGTLTGWSGQVGGGLLVAAVVVGFAVVAWLLGVVGTVLAHAGFTLTRDGEHLVIERGLFERRRASIPLARIQAVRIVEAVLRQPFGLVELHVESAGYGRQAGESTVLFPLLRRDEVLPFLATMTPELAVDVPLAPLPRAARRRYVARPVLNLPLLVASVALSVVLFPTGLIALLVLPLLLAFGWWQYHDAGWGTAGDALVLRTRTLGRTTSIVTRRRIQMGEVHQSPFQRRSRIATVGVRIASGSGGKVLVQQHVDEADAARLLSWVAAGRKADGTQVLS